MIQPIFRIKQYPKGWVVEVRKRRWYGKTYWTHCITVAGNYIDPWYHSTFDYAMDSLVFEIRCSTIENSKNKS